MEVIEVFGDPLKSFDAIEPADDHRGRSPRAVLPLESLRSRPTEFGPTSKMWGPFGREGEMVGSVGKA